ncbi:MAG: hypothetical protein S4CHLAM37_10980 [Chlamydiia bacterium]|nr:hypothetical protein [Chlamydiia bacterium]
MICRFFISLTFILAFINISYSDLKQSLSFNNNVGDCITIGVLSHPHNLQNNVHFQLITPKGQGPFPLVIYLHGAKSGPGILSARNSQDHFRCWLKEGVAVLVPSLPGFGYSDGPCDYCGEYTLEALNQVIDHVKSLENISEDRIGAVGFGMGAIAATLLGTKRDDLSCIAAASGMYNLHDAFADSFVLKWAFANNRFFPMNKEEIKKRSMYFQLEKIHTPILFLHSEDDPVVSCYQSIRAHQKLLQNKRKSYLVLIKRDTHQIPKKYSFPPITAFLKKHLLQED